MSSVPRELTHAEGLMIAGNRPLLTLVKAHFVIGPVAGLLAFAGLPLPVRNHVAVSMPILATALCQGFRLNYSPHYWWLEGATGSSGNVKATPLPGGSSDAAELGR